MKHRTLMLLVVLFVSFNISTAAENDGDFRVLMCVQCDDLSWRQNAGDVDYFASLKAEIRKRGGEIEYLEVGERISNSRLEGIELVIFVGRTKKLKSSEKNSLDNYIQNGGGFLILADSKKQKKIINPLLNNYGIKIGEVVKKGYSYGKHGTMELYEFAEPATIPRRTIEEAFVVSVWQIKCSDGAQQIMGRTIQAVSPTAIDQGFMAAGSNTGKGRVIAVGDVDIWRAAKCPT